jgi:hypothetical protein
MPVSIGGIAGRLAEYVGSMFELRAVVEARVSGDAPEFVVIYLPGCERDRRASVLMEIEKAGECYEPQLKRLARNVLRQRYTDGVIDEMLAPERVTYEDLARASSDSSSAEPPSILKNIFHDAAGSDGLLAAWLVSDARDGDIDAKEATRELAKLVQSRLGLDLQDVVLAKLRAIALRYVLVGEFRTDLKCPPPASLDGVARPKTKEEESAVRDLARRLRTSCPDKYPDLADRVEHEFGLSHAGIPGEALGSIDTFRFEERALIDHCGMLIVEQRFDDAIRLVSEREHSFWLDRDVSRKAQWEAKERDRADVRPMRDCHLNEGGLVQEQRLAEGVVLHLLGLLVTQKQLHEAVEPRGHGDVQRRLPDLFRNREVLAGTYPGFDFVQPSGFTKAEQIFGLGERELSGHRPLFLARYRL